jgi:hypothetical protein
MVGFCYLLSLGTRLSASIIRLVDCGGLFRRLPVSTTLSSPALSIVYLPRWSALLPNSTSSAKGVRHFINIQLDRSQPPSFSGFSHRRVSLRRNARIPCVKVLVTSALV